MPQTEIPLYQRRSAAPQHSKKKREKIYKLKKRDYITGALSFLLARAVMIGSMSPFAPAFFAVTFTKNRMPVTMLCALIGCLSAGMGVRSFKYLIALGIFALYKILFDKDNKGGVYAGAAVAGAGLFCGGIAVMLFDIVLIYNVLLLVLESLLCGFLTVLFRETADIIDKKEKPKGGASNEQLLSLLVVFGLALSGLGDMTRFGAVSLSEFVCAAAILLLGYCRGMAGGACAGAAAGLVCAMNSADMLPVIGIYTLCGFCAGCAKPLGKYGVAVAFALSAASLGFMTTAYIYGQVGILNLIIGAVLFMIVPKSRLEHTAAFINGCYISRSDRPYMERIQEIMLSRLDDISQAFTSLASSFDVISEKRAVKRGTDMAQVFDNTAGKICSGCGLRAHCWGKDAQLTRKTIVCVGKKLEEKGYADVLDTEQEFRKKCPHAPEFVAAANHFYEISRLNALWEGQIEESRQVLSGQYRGFASVVDALAASLQNDISCENKYEKKILSEAAKEKVFLKNICVFEKPNGSFEVEAELYDDEDDDAANLLLDAASSVLSQPMRIADMPGGKNRILLEPLLNFRLESGIATIKKDGEEKNGDACCVFGLSDNRYALVISDGMGSGSAAASESEVTVNLLRKLLTAGFDKTAAIQLINSALVLKNGQESFATIDLALIDLVNGKAEFVKIGAATGYICRADSIDSIFCSTLPVGILSEADIQLSCRRLSAGDYIIMLSDGVANAKKNASWVCETLIGIDENESPETVAEIILKEAIIHKRGAVDDDMTVIAAKILEK